MTAPSDPTAVQAVALDQVSVDLLLSGMRKRMEHLADPQAWKDDTERAVALHMASGVKLCL